MSLIISDYLQRMGSDGRRNERRNEVADNVAAFADMLKEFRVHGILLSQVNRDTAGEGRRPRMSDLSESGVIEQAAHNIILVHRPEYYCQDKENIPENIQGLAELIVDKARDGQPGIAQAKFVAEHTAFVNPTISDLEKWAS
jgi:replicative DNA helicase